MEVYIMNKDMVKSLLKLKEAVIEMETQWNKLSFDQHWKLSYKYPFRYDHTTTVNNIIDWVNHHTGHGKNK